MYDMVVEKFGVNLFVCIEADLLKVLFLPRGVFKTNQENKCRNEEKRQREIKVSY